MPILYNLCGVVVACALSVRLGYVWGSYRENKKWIDSIKHTMTKFNDQFLAALDAQSKPPQA